MPTNFSTNGVDLSNYIPRIQTYVASSSSTWTPNFTLISSPNNSLKISNVTIGSGTVVTFSSYNSASVALPISFAKYTPLFNNSILIVELELNYNLSGHGQDFISGQLSMSTTANTWTSSDTIICRKNQIYGAQGNGAGGRGTPFCNFVGYVNNTITSPLYFCFSVFTTSSSSDGICIDNLSYKITENYNGESNTNFLQNGVDVAKYIPQYSVYSNSSSSNIMPFINSVTFPYSFSPGKNGTNTSLQSTIYPIATVNYTPTMVNSDIVINFDGNIGNTSPQSGNDWYGGQISVSLSSAAATSTNTVIFSKIQYYAQGGDAIATGARGVSVTPMMGFYSNENISTKYFTFSTFGWSDDTWQVSFLNCTILEIPK